MGSEQRADDIYPASEVAQLSDYPSTRHSDRGDRDLFLSLPMLMVLLFFVAQLRAAVVMIPSAVPATAHWMLLALKTPMNRKRIRKG